MIVSLDPGKKRTACAYFSESDNRLVSVFWLKPGEAPDPLFAVSLVIIEKPNINGNTPNWQSTFDCGWYGAIVAGWFRAPIVEYEPNAWKATVKKPLHHQRLWRVLAKEERALLPVEVPGVIETACVRYARTGTVRNYEHEWHNLLDAVGVGLFHLGRTGRGGAKA